MAVARGTRIGSYEVISLLGAGGMGEVYRARDARLGRDVAIKILAARVAEDAILLARIEREARLLASLNHPSIATVHGVEDWQGTPAIVMELIEGETLAVKLFKEPLPIGDVVRVARQVSEALGVAHDRGIVHRDLKPANIHIRPDGAVKVLDFGLAKAVSPMGQIDTDQSVTTTGSIMGTAPYMSPEQARGQDVDRRSDIWSFGCIVYEMLTGRRAFSGPTPADTLVAVLSAEPDWSALPPETPDGLRALLHRCLQKDLKLRLRDLGDASFDYATTNHAFVGAIAHPPRVRPGRLLMLAAPILVVAGLVALGYVVANRMAGTSGPVNKFEVIADGLGDDPATFSGETGPGAGVLISPDGRSIVYPASGRLWVRELSALASRPLDGTERAASPTWSPDSAWVAYFLEGQLRKSPISGGAPVLVAVLPGVVVEAGGAGWAADGTVYFTTGNGPLWRVSSEGGDPVRVVDIETGVLDYHDAVVGGGRPLLVSHYTNNQHSIDIIEDGKRQVLFGPVPQVIRHAAFSASGHIVYQRVDQNPGIWAVAVEPRTLRPRGQPFLVAAGGLRPSVAADGTLVYVSDEKWGQVRLSFVDRAGRVVGDVGDARRGLRHPALSPKGDRVAVVAPTEQADELFTIDVASGTTTQLTFKGVRGDPAWDPSGTRVAFSCGATGREGGICAVTPENNVEPELIMPGASQADYAPDGRLLAYILLDDKTRTDVWTSPLDRSSPPQLIRQSPAFDFSPKVSPDGKFIAYGSSELGRPEVFVADYPVPRRRWQVSNAAGAQPSWNPRGGELFYLDSGGRLQSVRIDGGGRAARPQVLFAESAPRAHLALGYAPTADGDRFLVVRDIERGATRPRITVVQNWFAEFAPRQ